ncbi:MAG: 2-hydroxyacid dehydrogenase [Pseudomonadota bacterium]
MKPQLLVLAKGSSTPAMDELEHTFDCHHLWQVAPAERAAFIGTVGAAIRGVFTTGTVGVTAAQLELLPALEIVAVHGVGVDAVALTAAGARGIRVTNTPGVLTDDVADLALTLLLASARRLAALERHVRSGAWEGGVPLAPSRSVRGKVAGIFGFGAIGQAIGHRMQAFGMEVRYYQRSEVVGVHAVRSASLLALAEESDFLIVAVPGGAATRYAVDAHVLAALGAQGTLINVARGSVVDQEALIAALDAGRLGAAALDVYADEPQVPQALRESDKVVLTPHVGSLTVETRYAMGRLALDNLVAHFAGAPLLTPVDTVPTTF